MDRNEIHKKQVVLEIPDMNTAKVIQDLVYKEIDGEKLTADIYYPASYSKEDSLPSVIFIHGDAPWENLRTIKESGQYTSWGQLAAASGLIGITFTHRSTHGFTDLLGPTEDILDLFQYVQSCASELKIDSNRIGVWVCSAGGPTGLTALLKTKPEWAKCLVSYYSLMDLFDLKHELSEKQINEFSAINYLSDTPDRLPPMYVVKAELDSLIFNNSIDRFVHEAECLSVPVHLVNHSSGHHGFDLFDDNELSKEIIFETLTFFRTNLHVT
ncbi:alpha/beta hydrolase [Brevibacillus fortis]|uniref:alpha/beta hydrolase n=1 Tax=Brevibacillus fortis TaxID=2126352 RepID=UPI0038FD0560